MPLPNLLASRFGRLLAFFLLYLTEGIPLGFAATAVATQLRRDDVGPATIGAFVGSFYLPWAFKWAFGPIIDVLPIPRLGRRRGWILVTQVLMAATLLSAMAIELPGQLWLFTIVLLVHNTFGAMQDVAIDALACNTLAEHERGTANGMMFAGAYSGMALGGSGVLFLSDVTGFQPTFLFVAGAILLVTTFVVWPMREPDGPVRPRSATPWRTLAADLHRFALTAFRSFLGSRGAFCGLFFALLPAGALSLGLALQSNLAVELGLNDTQVAWLSLWSTVIAAAFCVVGGVLSDRFGRRRTLFLYIVLLGLPVLYLAQQLTHHGWIMPIDPTSPDRPVPPVALVTAFWTATLIYSAFQGLMYGTRSALYMDVTNPAVAATQFTAYMALMNVAIAYSATWQGAAIEAWGYPRTMLADVALGLVCLVFIPFMAKVAVVQGAPTGDGRAPRRARILALLLGATCLAWLPVRAASVWLGTFLPMSDTLYTVAFVASAAFLLAAAASLFRSSPRLSVAAIVVAPLLLCMQVRHHVDALGARLAWLADPVFAADLVEGFVRAAPLAAGVVLLALAVHPWREMERVEQG